MAKELLVEAYTSRESLSTFIEEYIKQQAKEDVPYRDDGVWLGDLHMRESEIRVELRVELDELEQLGLVRRDQTGESAQYNLTDYGKNFISTIKPNF